jgi:N-acetylneuraminic acid mutarotase
VLAYYVPRIGKKKIMKKTILVVLVLVLSLASVSFAQEGKWTRKADMPTERYGLSTSVVNGRIYAIGGRAGGQFFATVDVYNPVTDTWAKKADMPMGRNNLSTCVVGGKIYAVGGTGRGSIGPTAIIEEYDPATDTWTRKADMPAERWNLYTSVVNGKIYAIGGYHRGGSGLGPTTVEEYDPVTNTWRSRADMPTGRSGLATSAVGGKIYAIGGRTWDNLTSRATYFPTVEEYDPVTDTWTRRTDMPTARADLSTSVVDGKIYAIGGESDEVPFLSTVEVYDPVTDVWTPKADMMPTGRRAFGTSVVDGRIYAIGGQPGPWPQVTGVVEVYQPTPWFFAHGPNPADGSLHPDTWVNLSWGAGDFAVSHDVYLGYSFDDVNDGLGDAFRGNQAVMFLSAGFPGFPYPDGLVRGTTYYWRVDEVNDTEPDSPWKGNVWSFTVQPKIAYNPVPSDGAEFVDLDVELSWMAGLDAALHTVYFGDNFDDVNNATGGLQQGKTTYTPGLLELAKTYYWRVDEFGVGRGAETHTGDVWSFVTEGAAESPDPSNEATSVEMNTKLSWAPADHAASHEVYFGTDKEAVRNANTSSPEYKGVQTLGAESFDPGILSWDTTYYWRVDEVNSIHPDSPWPGSVWGFRTGDFFVIDDFEDYNISSNEIWWSWKDGAGYANHPTEPPYAGNGTGSRVGDDSTGSTAYEGRPLGGRQSMPYQYDNNEADSLKYSEATLTLTDLRNWTENGVSTLSIWSGADGDWNTNTSPNDDERMYVVLNGNVVVYHDDPYVTDIYNWTEWRIDLQDFADLGVDLTNVQTIGLGFGNRNDPQPGGRGLMFFDNIRLVR